MLAKVVNCLQFISAIDALITYHSPFAIEMKMIYNKSATKQNI
jgi:hypothetical protein